MRLYPLPRSVSRSLKQFTTVHNRLFHTSESERMTKLPRQRILLGQAIIVAIVAALWFAARDPVAATPVRGELASRFQFKKIAIPAADTLLTTTNYVAVNPHLKEIATWMSSVGAAVSTFDIDGDGLANDICVADPRSRDVRVVPAPETGDRYAPTYWSRPVPGTTRQRPFRPAAGLATSTRTALQMSS